MENKETIVRETHYEYGENEKLVSMTVNETITNPRCDGCNDEDLVSSGIEIVDSGVAFSDIAAALLGIGMGLFAAIMMFNRH